MRDRLDPQGTDGPGSSDAGDSPGNDTARAGRLAQRRQVVRKALEASGELADTVAEVATDIVIQVIGSIVP